jgi:hypothetical protein
VHVVVLVRESLLTVRVDAAPVVQIEIGHHSMGLIYMVFDSTQPCFADVNSHHVASKVSADQRGKNKACLRFTDALRPLIPFCTAPTACAGLDAGVARDELVRMFVNSSNLRSHTTGTWIRW